MRAKILSEDLPDNVSLWRAPSMDGSPSEAVPESTDAPNEAGEVVVQPEALRPMTADQLAAIEEAAREEGFRQGHAEGFAIGEEEGRRKAEEWVSLVDGLARPLDALDQRVIDELLALAVAVSRQIVRRELQLAPDEVVRVIREALGALPSQAADIRVELNPQDAELVREVLHDGEGERAWRIVEDPALSRGGCRVQSDVSRVDATVERRLNQVIAATLGDMRGGRGE